MSYLINGERVRLLREKLPGRPSIRKFAHKAGLNYVTLARIENGKSGASPKMIDRLAKSLGVPPSAITMLEDYSSWKIELWMEQSLGDTIRIKCEAERRTIDQQIHFLLEQWAKGNLIIKAQQSQKGKRIQVEAHWGRPGHGHKEAGNG